MEREKSARIAQPCNDDSYQRAYLSSMIKTAVAR